MNFFQYYWRIDKTFNRVRLMEINFPISDSDRINESLISKETLKLLNNTIEKYNVVIGGDYIFNKIYGFSQVGEVFIYSNAITDEHISETGIEIKSDFRLFPIKGEIFFINKENCHWVTKSVLLFTYYTLRFYEKTRKHDWKIRILVDDFIENGFEEDIEIFKPTAKYVEKPKGRVLPTKFLTTV